MRQELPAYTEALLRDVEHALEVETVRLMPRLVRLVGPARAKLVAVTVSAHRPSLGTPNTCAPQVLQL